VQCQASSAKMEGLLVRKQHVPTPQSEVYGIDNSEGGHPPMSWPGALGTGKRTLDVHSPINAMPGKSPRSTADTYPSKAIQPVLIESKAPSLLD